MKWDNVIITTDGGERVEATAPVIISASRATDIPAFYAPWFFERLRRGYVRWINPFNNRPQYVSFQRTRFIVFWSKNPAPILPYLPLLRNKGIGCYVQYTLNDYESEGLEPNVPPLNDRIEVFRNLVDALGPGSVVWRFDPLILTDTLDIDALLQKISRIAEHLAGCAERLVFSFADIATYRRVGPNLRSAGVNYREWTEPDMRDFAEGLCELQLGLHLSTCAESIDLANYGISHNRCIDPDLIAQLAPDDAVLQNHLFGVKRDRGQRPLCGCISSKDIGQYGTCPHGCLYCYANSSPLAAVTNYRRHLCNPLHDSII